MSTKKLAAFVMNEYFQLFAKGLSAEKIKKQMLNTFPGYTEANYKNDLPLYSAYVKRQLDEEEKVTEMMTMPLTDETITEFIRLVRSGLPVPKVGAILNIPLPTIYEVWFKKYPMFKMQVEYARETSKAKVIQTLYKRAQGYNTVLKTKSTTIDSKGESTTTSEREEHVTGSVEAAKFWLINTCPEEWSLTGTASDSGNKGQILEAIGDMATLSDEDKKALEDRNKV